MQANRISPVDHPSIESFIWNQISSQAIIFQYVIHFECSSRGKCRRISALNGCMAVPFFDWIELTFNESVSNIKW